jgi:hypothetical protein
MEPVSRQRIGKHVPAATNTHATIELLLETVFPPWSVQMGYKEYKWSDPLSWELSPVKKRARLRLWKGDFMCAVVTVRLLQFPC